VHIPKNLDITRAAPLLCAGITLYSPLRHWKAGKGTQVGIIGLGGLGHMGVKFAVAMGAEVTVITRSPDKADEARKLGAQHVIVSTDEQAMANAAHSFDVLIDTIPSEHDLSPYIDILAVDGTLVLVGPINPMPGFHGGSLISARKNIAGSCIGSMAELREMLDFCAKNNVLPDVDMIDMKDINECWDAMVAGKMGHRYVIDIEKSFSGE